MDVKHGRFTESEKQALSDAAEEYATANGLSTTNYDWLWTASADGRRGSMTAIAAAAPHRTRKAVWAFLRRHLSANARQVRVHRACD